MEICIAKGTPTERIEPTSPYHSSLMLYLMRHRLLWKGLFLFSDLLSPEFVLGKTTFRSDKMNSKCGRPEISKISPKTHVLRFLNVISHLHTIYTQLVRFELPNPNMFAITKFFTYTDETWCARRANPACKVHAAQGGRKLGEKLVKFRSLDRKC